MYIRKKPTKLGRSDSRCYISILGGLLKMSLTRESDWDALAFKKWSRMSWLWWCFVCFVSTLECESRCRFLPWRQIRWWLEVKLILPGFYLDWIMPRQPNMAAPSPCTCHTWIFWYRTTIAAAPCHQLWHIILQFSKGSKAFHRKIRILSLWHIICAVNAHQFSRYNR